MKIAVVSTVYKRTPPVGYGGIERVVHTYVEEMVRRGNEVVMFATPGSYCSGTTVEVSAYDPTSAPSGVTSKKSQLSEEPLYEAMRTYLDSHSVDIIHDWSLLQLYVRRHPERFPFLVSSCIPLSPSHATPNLVVSSKAHSNAVGGNPPFVRYGLDLQAWNPMYRKDNHLIHIAKIARYKGQHEAAWAAFRSRRELWLAGNVEDKLYFHGLVRPLAKLLPGIRLMGELTNTQGELRKARALVQTPKWLDVFPLIVLEALACGTPVITYAEGGVVEQIESGINGFLCQTREGLSEAMERIDEISPQTCRAFAEEHFTVARMAQEYETLLTQVLDGECW
jgi:glycosyltransferase involved in cell wall biosynthesis